MVKASVEIKHNRNGLIEGRSNGISFAFLKEKSRGKYETIMPVSPCKDYLNDVVYMENKKRDKSIFGTVYGFSHEPEDLFKNKHRIPLLVKDFGMGNYSGESIRNKHNAVIDFINDIEKLTGIERSTIKLKTKKDDEFVFLISRKWTENPITISLYSLLVRVGVGYSKHSNVKDFLAKIKRPSTEAFYIRNIFFNLPLGEKILSGEIFGLNYYSNLTNFGIYNMNNVHNSGIVTLKIRINESLLKTK